MILKILYNNILTKVNNLNWDYLPSQIGIALNMSAGYLSDLLKKETGISAQEHIHNHIVHKAKYLLLNSNDSVSEIAFQLGYNYPQHFSKLFKSKTGLTPVNFRKLN